MTEETQDLARRVRDQTVNSARDFLKASLGRLKEGLRGDRSQLEDLAEQLRPEETRTQVRELIDSYSAIEESIEEAARLQDTGEDQPPLTPITCRPSPVTITPQRYRRPAVPDREGSRHAR